MFPFQWLLQSEVHNFNAEIEQQLPQEVLQYQTSSFMPRAEMDAPTGRPGLDKIRFRSP